MLTPELEARRLSQLDNVVSLETRKTRRSLVGHPHGTSVRHYLKASAAVEPRRCVNSF
jgi:hypothetical protein